MTESAVLLANKLALEFIESRKTSHKSFLTHSEKDIEDFDSDTVPVIAQAEASLSIALENWILTCTRA